MVSIQISTKNNSNKQTKPKTIKNKVNCLHNKRLLRISNKRRQKRSWASPHKLNEKSKTKIT